jgi:flagellum-specific ATP synthase
VLDSISRLARDVTSREHQQAAACVRELMAVYRDHEDLISIGAYRRGSNPRVDRAIDLRDSIDVFLRQAVDQPADHESARDELFRLAARAQP